MLRLKLYASDLDDLHKSQRTRDLGLVPTRYNQGDSQGEGAALNCPLEEIVTKDLLLGEHKMEVQELKLSV